MNTPGGIGRRCESSALSIWLLGLHVGRRAHVRDAFQQTGPAKHSAFHEKDEYGIQEDGCADPGMMKRFLKASGALACSPHGLGSKPGSHAKLVVCLCAAVWFVPFSWAKASEAGRKDSCLAALHFHEKSVRHWISERCHERPLIAEDEINALGEIARYPAQARDVQVEVLRILYDRVGIEVSALGYAYLNDRINVSRGEPQDYGAIPAIHGGRAKAPKLGVSVDTARDRLGLNSALDFYARVNRLIDSGSSATELLRPQLTLTSPVAPTKPDLRIKLMRLLERDRRSQMPGFSAKSRGRIQKAGARAVSKILDEHGFPGASEVGRSGVQAVFFLVQHSAGMPDLMSDALHLMEPLVRSGDMPRVYYALLVDRLHVLNNMPQIYGTQSGRDETGFFMYPTADMPRVNQRRQSMYMSPLDLDELPPQRWP